MARLLVLGSSNTDMTVRLPTLPQPGQTVLGGALAVGPGGKGANQAVAAARAGGSVVFVTAVGDDEFGRRALDGYRREGIDVSNALIREATPSGVALIFVDDHGENMIGVASGANASMGETDIDRLPDDVFEPGGWLLVAGLELPMAAVRRAAERASDRGMKIVLNLAPCPEEGIARALRDRVDVIILNRGELEFLMEIETGTLEGFRRAADSLRFTRPVFHVVVTLGAEGCLILDERGVDHLIPAHPVEAVDTVGAGDAFNGALTVALAEGRPLVEAARWATAAAALAVTKIGAQAALPSRAEIDGLAGSMVR